jgi:nitroreductase
MKNEVINSIMKRRSVRAYTKEQISDSDLEIIIKAGLYAPSSMNQQNWHFTVVQNQELLNEMNAKAKISGLGTGNEHIEKMMSNPVLHIFYNAPTVIFTSIEKDTYSPETNCAAAMQNMLLAAQSLGIASCCIGLSRYLFLGDYKDEYIKKLKVPENFLPGYAITLGFNKGNPADALPRREGTVNYIK